MIGSNLMHTIVVETVRLARTVRFNQCPYLGPRSELRKMKILISTVLIVLELMVTASGQVGITAADVTKELAELRSRRETLLTRYSPEYRDVKAIDKRIAELEKQLPEASKSPKFTEAQQKLLLDKLNAELGMQFCSVSPDSSDCVTTDHRKLYADAIVKIVRDSVLVQHLLADAVRGHEANKSATGSAIQVSPIADQQNTELMRLIVAQNQRMIELLEQLVKKRP